MDFELTPDGIIYKLTAPLVNSFVESKMKDVFPIKVNELLASQVSDLLNKFVTKKPLHLIPQISKISLEKMEIEDVYLKGLVQLTDPHLSIKLSE